MSNKKPHEEPAAGHSADKTEQPETVAPQQPAKLISLQRSRLIGQGLRALYSEVAAEPVPDAFLDILKEADEKAATTGKTEPLTTGGGAKIFVLGANVSSAPQKQGG